VHSNSFDEFVNSLFNFLVLIFLSIGIIFCFPFVCNIVPLNLKMLTKGLTSYFRDFFMLTLLKIDSKFDVCEGS